MDENQIKREWQAFVVENLTTPADIVAYAAEALRDSENREEAQAHAETIERAWARQQQQQETQQVRGLGNLQAAVDRLDLLLGARRR